MEASQRFPELAASLCRVHMKTASSNAFFMTTKTQPGLDDKPEVFENLSFDLPSSFHFLDGRWKGFRS